MEVACTRRVVSSWATLGGSVSARGLRRATCRRPALPSRGVSGQASASFVKLKRCLPAASRCDFFKHLSSSDFSGARHEKLVVPRTPRQPTRTFRVAAALGDGGSLVGENFGARDPFDAEIESNFGAKVLGNADTEHIILIPDVSNIAGLSAKSCQPLPRGTKPMTFEEARPMLRQIVGWKIIDKDGVLCIQASWVAKDFKAGLELFKRFSEVAEAENHHPDLHLEGYNKVTIEVYTHSVGGLSVNDFILAAKIDKINVKDLIKKTNKFWA